MTSSLETKIQPENAASVDDWENTDGEAWQEQLQERFKQVKILERAKADKDALLEKARQDEALSKAAAASRSEALNPHLNTPAVQMQILRRPKSSDQLEELERAKKEQEEREKAQKKPTFEERQAAYELARNRILGEDYKPESTAATPTNSGHSTSRNRSPETVTPRRQSPEVAYPYPSYPPVQHQMYMRTAQQQQQYNIVTTHMLPLPQHSIDYNAISLNPNAQPFVPYVDTSRPPPPMINTAGFAPQIAQQIPTFHTGQYLGGAAAPPNAYSQGPYPPPSSFGRPPLNLYPEYAPGAAPIQVKIETGQSQRQRNNKNKKKKKPDSS